MGWRKPVSVGRGIILGMCRRSYVNLIGVLRIPLAGKHRYKREKEQHTATPEAKHKKYPDLET
jgi:hypothetical protein